MADDVARRALMETGSEDAVTVNQRALIDKILARYAAEFTVFRELLQNADDAGATHCQLHFDTSNSGPAIQPASSSSSSLPDFKAPLVKWTFKNDGTPFSSSDWSRLRRIAEGNPDPDRIGAFGVGFYSLFSICEEPVVSSGEELMGFFWKGDSLFTRRAKNPTSATDLSPSKKPWTTFFMSLRSPSALPESPLQLARFLATSLTFTSNVCNIDLFFDSHLLCKLSKSLEDTRPLALPSHLNPFSPEKVMRVEKVESRGMRIDVEAMAILWESERERLRIEREREMRPSLTAALTKSGGLTSMLQSAFGGGKSKEKSSSSIAAKKDSIPESEVEQIARLLKMHPAKALLRVATSHIDVRADHAFKKELERSTKKPPPTKTAFNLIWVGKEDYDTSNGDAIIEGQTGSMQSGIQDVGPKIIFDGLMPNLNKMGNVFIGFRTHQTTGFAGHVAARFIPTVERESIDFIDRHCARWNTELLAIGGYTCRAVYEAEMELLKRLWTDSSDEDGKAMRERLLARALHTMKFLTIKASSPSPRVSTTLLTSFFNASRQSILTIASTQGVKVSSSVRLPNAVLLEFIKRLPVIPPAHIESAPEFFDQVRSRNLVKDVTMEDVFGELGSRALDVDEMIACLRWWINVSKHPGYDTRLRSRLLDSAVVSLENGKDSKASAIQALGSVKQVLNPQRVPADVPLPPTCLDYEVSKAFSVSELSTTYDWAELSIPAWLAHLSKTSSDSSCPVETNIQLSPHFAEKVFGILSRSWGNLSSKQQTETVEILSSLTCLPTKQGMRLPNQSYFPNVSLFDDLAIVEFPSSPIKGNLEKVLFALQVRKHVELQLIFTRLLGGGDWSHVELLSYLTSIRDSLSALEVDRLKKTPIWPKEGEVGPPGKDGKPRVIRYKASQLYEPSETLRGLGLPLLDWSSKGVTKTWRSNSDEARFAVELGLLKNPPLDSILGLASVEDEAIRSKALAYFLEKQAYRDLYNLSSSQNFAFVPCHLATEDGKAGQFSRLKPTEVFTNEGAQAMGFAVVAGIAPTDVPKLQLRSDPPPSMLISRLVNHPPRSLDKARAVFEYLASVQTTFSSHDISVLRQASFVPIVIPPTSGEKESREVKLVPPGACYFGSNDTVGAFRSVFLYVPDFGGKANSFLRLVGVSNEPSIEEIATRLISDPTKFYNLCGSVEAYLSLLRQIASNWSRIKTPLRKVMRGSAFLLGSKRVKNGGPSSGNAVTSDKQAISQNLLEDEDESGDEGEDAGMLVHSLKRPSEVVIFDDANAGMIFGSSLFSAPHEDLLEQGLYAQLGSPKLSTLIEERYTTVGRLLPDSKRCKEVRALILERTPLFLFECRQSGNKGDIRHDADWLKSALEVVEVDGEGLRLSRILRFNGQQEQDVQKSSAMAQWEGVGKRKVKLFIAGNMNIDWFEVAATLNKFLLERQRLQEVLLFMTLLSTSLRDLKRRGFHVDKILQQRKAEREGLQRAQMEQQRQAQLEALSKPPSDEQFREWSHQISTMFPDADVDGIETTLRRQKEDHFEKALALMTEGKYEKRQPGKSTRGRASSPGFNARGGEDDATVPPGALPHSMNGTNSGGGGFFSSFKDRWKKPESSLASGTSSIIRSPLITGVTGRSTDSSSVKEPQLQSSSTAAGSIANKPAEQPSSLDSIRRNVLSAISASKPDASTSIHSEARTTNIKEANSTYCDNSGVAADLTLAGEVAGMKVYLGNDLDVNETMSRNQAALERLIGTIYRPIGAIFGLDPRSMHVFVDTKGPTIAFNRGGTIWLNLRFYLAWHDEDVQKGHLVDALISVYFSVAHEIAHNLEQAHNAQHEFYTSALCEQFFMSLANYIASLEGTKKA